MNEQTSPNQPRRALLLIGSAKKEHESTSEALGNFLLAQLAERGFSTDTRYVHRALRSHDRCQELLNLIDSTDLFVLAFPLYVDSLPYLVTQALELIAAHRQAQLSTHKPQFVALANCGFPEAKHNDTALAICRVFARQANLQWAGGLGLGCGGVIGGRALVEVSASARTVRPALISVAEALANQQPLPATAIDLIAKPIIPRRLYTSMAGIGWRVQAWENHAYSKLSDQPLTLPTGAASS